VCQIQTCWTSSKKLLISHKKHIESNSVIELSYVLFVPFCGY